MLKIKTIKKNHCEIIVFVLSGFAISRPNSYVFDLCTYVFILFLCLRQCQLQKHLTNFFSSRFFFKSIFIMCFFSISLDIKHTLSHIENIRWPYKIIEMKTKDFYCTTELTKRQQQKKRKKQKFVFKQIFSKYCFT